MPYNNKKIAKNIKLFNEFAIRKLKASLKL